MGLPRLALVPATPAHAESLMRGARRIDVEEWVGATGRPVLPLLLRCIERAGEEAQAIVEVGGECLVIWGAAAAPSSGPGVGIAWLIATDRSLSRLKSCQAHFAQGIARMHLRFPLLEAWSYDRNTVHHRWMERMGFNRTGQAARLGRLGCTYLLFTHSNEEACALTR